MEDSVLAAGSRGGLFRTPLGRGSGLGTAAASTTQDISGLWNVG